MTEEHAGERFGLRMLAAYDGTEFHGFQKQPGLRTVAGVINDAIRRLDPLGSEVRCASRTDSGVHARGQVVAFDSARSLPPKGWRLLLNSALPDDVSVRAIEPCVVGFEPRFDSVGKLYRYLVHVGESRDPLRDRHSFHLGPSRAKKPLRNRAGSAVDYLDVEAMREAGQRLLGRHDFRAFRSADDVRENTVRTLRDVRVITPFGGQDDSLALEFEGDAFMKNMVRILVGTLLDVGRGAKAPASMARLLGPAARREDAGPTSPAHGLCLMRVDLGRSELCRPGDSA